ncbi:hypothetical protein [Phenylobacterium sp. RIFCSPHIGHO2_01_FULL_69_31]|uniref:hypothetical protein n=1 Tax=Phenylobacterium sp. RIFCSPHIGHO2_01_FULL_69_31 TaxID=1801944 RepID=UPI0025CDA0A1|nr:hypothetical protein [Phenylobacterium sp. RIFCSPHIGHO2_01_FULL_69_31]
MDGKPFSIELVLDYETGQTSYKTTNPGSGGVVPKHHVPPQIHRFLTEQFLSLFIFDGELASRLLDPRKTEADRAVDALCQLYLLDAVSDFTGDYWERATKNQTAKTSTGLTKAQDTLTQLRKREKTLQSGLADAKAKLGKLGSEMEDLEQKIKDHVGRVAAVREQFIAAEKDLITSKGGVDTASTALMAAMRLPHALHPKLAEDLEALRDNLDRLKLPENTSAQFFEELVREKLCICGRPMDHEAQDHIKTEAKRYLDSEDAGIINALKRDIETLAAKPEEEGAGHVRVTNLAKSLGKAAREEVDAAGRVRALKQQLIDGGDTELEAWEARLDAATGEYVNCEALIAEIEGPGEPDTPDDQLRSVSQIQKRIKEVAGRIADITQTVRLKAQTEIIQSILSKAAHRARTQIKAELLAQSNARLQTILVNDPLQIERIDGALRLQGQDEASKGQTLSVGYTFLMEVLHRGNNDFPLIVDSPANQIDEGVRRRVGRLIPELCSQFVGFTINTERAGFVETLETAAEDVAFITLFRKTEGTARLMKNLPPGRFVETSNAMLVTDRDYFYRFDVKEEEEGAGVVQAAH